MKMDFVVAWVDGNDPAHRERLRPYLDPDKARRSDIAGPERLRERGEVKWCIASIIRFAGSFTRKIFIVVNHQDPHVKEFIDRWFPDNDIPIELVEQDRLFTEAEREKYLPVFNSVAVETVMSRIPGLSDNFVYMNDDFFLVAPVRETDFVVDGKPVAYSQWHPARWAAFVHWLRPRKGGKKVLTFRDSMRPAARILGKGHFQRISHVPYPLSSSWLNAFFASRPDVVDANLGTRFRSPRQVNVQSLYYTAAVDGGLCVRRSAAGRKAYMKVSWKKPGYPRRKLDEIDNHPSVIFLCANALYKFSEEDWDYFRRWMNRRLGLDPEAGK